MSFIEIVTNNEHTGKLILLTSTTPCVDLRNAIHMHSVRLTGFQRSGDTTNENGLPGIQRHGRVQHEVGVGQTPRSYLNGFVFDGRRRNAQVQFVVVLNACVNQLLHRGFVLHGGEKNHKKKKKKRLTHRKPVVYTI